MVDNSEADEFLKEIHDNLLKQEVLEATKSVNILGLVLTNSEEAITQVEAGGRLGDRGHCEIRCKIKLGEACRSENTSKIPT